MKKVLYSAISIIIGLIALLTSLFALRQIAKLTQLVLTTIKEGVDAFSFGYISVTIFWDVILIAISYFLYRFTMYSWKMKSL